MGAVTVQLDPVALREATSQAIMGILTPEIRAQIIQNAISALLKPSTDSWNRDKSPLQEAFDLAVVKCAKETAVEFVKGDKAIMEQLTVLCRKTTDKMLAIDADKLAERMSEAFISALGRDR